MAVLNSNEKIYQSLMILRVRKEQKSGIAMLLEKVTV
jgi:hypothetical protein